MLFTNNSAMFSTMSQARQETLHQAPFTVTVEQPEGLFRVLKAASDRRVDLPPDSCLGSLELQEGLLSRMDGGILEFIPREAAYRLGFVGKYKEATSSYWPESEIQQLKTLLEQHYPLRVIGRRQNLQGKNLLFVHDVLDESTLLILLGWPDERTQWAQRVKELDEKVRGSEYGRLVFEDELKMLLHDEGAKLPNTPLIIEFSELHIVKFDLKPFILRGEEDFIKKMKELGTYIERVVHYVAQIKGLSQSGNFRICPPP